jgi:flagellar assembly protein FliH
MAKLPGRIPAEQITSAKSWHLPEIQQGADSPVIKLFARALPPPRILLSASPAKSRPAETTLDTEPTTSNPSEQEHATVDHSTASEGVGSQAGAANPGLDIEQPVPSPPESQSTEFSNDPVSDGVDAGPTPQKTEAVGYEEGLKKGETEGFVKGEKTGYDAGLAAGTEAGRTQAENTFNQEVKDQRAAITSLQQAFLEPPNFDAELQEELVTLITELTKTIVCREIKTQPEMIRDLVAEGLRALPHGSDKPRVFVNPSDIELAQSVSHQDVEFIADAGLARGGCRVVCGQSSVEAGVAQRIRDALLATCRGEEVSEIEETDLQALESEIEIEIEIERKVDNFDAE